MQVTVPPERYDHPYRDGPVVERVLPLDEVRRLCAEIGIHADGCSGYLQDGSKGCFIAIPTDGFDTVDAYRRHEIGHCNGWGKDHPPD